MVEHDHYQPKLSKEEKNWGVIAHLSPLLAFVFPFFGNIIGPLIVYLIKKDEGEFIRENAVEVLNFQISVTLYTIVSVILIFVIIGIFALIALGILTLVCLILGAVKASDGITFKYPLAIPFIKA